MARRTRTTRPTLASRTAQALRAAQYGRVSRLRDGETADESESVETQDEECIEAAEDRGWQIVARYADPGISASQFTDAPRPEWNKLVAAVPNGEFDVVIMWETARGDRKPLEWLQFLYLCRDHDVLIHIYNHDESAGGVTYDLHNPTHLDKLAREGLDNAKAPVETSARLRRIKRQRRKKGLPDGAIPWGYVREYDPRTGKIVRQGIDETVASTVRLVIHQVAASRPQVRIKDDLEAAGILTPGGLEAWNLSTIRNIATNPAYISVIRDHDGSEYPAQWKPILALPGEHADDCDGGPCWGCVPDLETFHKAGAVLATRAAKYSNHGSRPGAARHLLSYIVECGEDGCDLVMGANVSLKHSIYFCTAGHNAIRMDFLDAWVTRVLIEYYSAEERYDEIMRSDDALARAARAEMNRVNAELEALYAKVARPGAISQRMADAQEAALLAQLAAAETQATEAAVPPVLRDLMTGPREELAQRWIDLGETAGVGAQREIIQMTMRVVVVSAGGKHRKVRPMLPPEERVSILPPR